VLPDAVCLPPIRRGDLSRDIEEGVNVVGIIDGEFFQSMAVTPSEVLDALRTGMAVYGAGSIGALRAAELHEFGMVGCGRIFEHIRDTPYFLDDYLGVTFEDATSPHVSLPMIDFSATLEALTKAGSLDEASAEQLYIQYASLHFSERSLARLVKLPALMNAPHLIHAMDIVTSNIINQKACDGWGLLHRIHDDILQVAHLNSTLQLHKQGLRHGHSYSSTSDVPTCKLRTEALAGG
jgi:hypothetical protein